MNVTLTFATVLPNKSNLSTLFGQRLLNKYKWSPAPKKILFVVS